jgi:hypothetical protein
LIGLHIRTTFIVFYIMGLGPDKHGALRGLKFYEFILYYIIFFI